MSSALRNEKNKRVRVRGDAKAQVLKAPFGWLVAGELARPATKHMSVGAKLLAFASQPTKTKKDDLSIILLGGA